jgi:ABC-2 type transport system ATP-binding protein
MAAIEIQGLRKEYRSMRGRTTVALDGLDLTVAKGEVFGFLGPNGSGKTTTIRCLLGLARPDAGTMRLLGADPTTDLHTVIRRVGALVESPAFFPNFSGHRNLSVLSGIYGIDDGRVRHVLDQVGLAERGRDTYKSYSLGMRQRLGIAAALLKEPEVLILDEPANGLDPAGIREIRELLRGLADDGCSVLVSSHILAEVQQLCDQVAIMARGRRVTQGPVAQVLDQRSNRRLLVRMEDLDAGLKVLQAAGFAASRHDHTLTIETEPRAAGSQVCRLLASQGLYPYEIRPQEADLESVFLQLTQEEVAA